MYSRTFLLSALAASLRCANGMKLNATDPASIRAVALNLTQGIMSYYTNANASGEKVGLFPGPFNTAPAGPYYWWESGAMWGGLMDYQALTGDTQYQQEILNAMAAQVGPAYDFVVPEQYYDEANDDQAFWVFNALTALEYSLPALPCPSGGTQPCETAWLALADNAFNLYVARYLHDESTCNGGLKWQYTPSAAGYNYKNAISNGGFFNIAARLFRYTGNATYGEWATRVYDWETSVGFISPEFAVFDGAGDDGTANCSAIDTDQWSYNLAVHVAGAAAMSAANANGTGSVWADRVSGFVSAAAIFFGGPTGNATDVMYEQKCEATNACNTDQLSFKAYLSRFLGKAAALVPAVAGNVTTLLAASATAAASSCSGLGNNTCGTRWYVEGWDGTMGLGQELSALEVVQGLLAPGGPEFATAS